MGDDTSIADFVESFWPLDMRFETQDALPFPECKEDLLTRYNPEVIKRIEQLIDQRDEKLNHYVSEGVEEYCEITNLVFQHRMHERWYPGMALGSRTVLELLINYFQTRQEPEILLDLGCGSGMVDIGLLQRLPTLKKVYAVDISAHALAVTKENAERKIPGRAHTLQYVQQDYTSEEFQNYLKEQLPEGAQCILTLFPMGGVSEVLQYVPQLLHPEGEILIGTAIRDNELGFKLPWKQAIEQLQYQHRSVAYHRGLHCEEGILHKQVTEKTCILLSRMTLQ